MIKLQLFFMVCFSSTTFFSQEVVKESRFKIGIHGAPEYYIPRASNKSKNGSTYSNIVEAQNRNFSPGFSYSLGVQVIYNLNKFFELTSGVGFTQLNGNYNDNANWNGFPNIEFRTSAYYGEIPLMLSFTKGEKKIKFVSSFDVAFLFAQHYKLRYSQESLEFYAFNDHEIVQKAEKFDVNFRIGLSLGIDYQVAAKTHLRFQPQIKHGWLINPDGLVNNSFVNIGFNCGLIREF